MVYDDISLIQINVTYILNMDSIGIGCEQNLLSQKYGDKFQSFGRHNFMVTLTDNITLFVETNEHSSTEAILNKDGIEIDITSSYMHFAESDPDSCAMELCKWVEEKFLDRNVEYGFDDVYQSLDNDRTNSRNRKMNVSTMRCSFSSQVTKIYSWGNGCRVRKPDDSQVNFSACALTCHNKGLNLKNLTGKNKIVQDCIVNSPKYTSLIESIVDKLSSDASIHTISINCTRGKHRSVAVAEMLKEELFPNATVIHLELHR